MGGRGPVDPDPHFLGSGAREGIDAMPAKIEKYANMKKQQKHTAWGPADWFLYDRDLRHERVNAINILR